MLTWMCWQLTEYGVVAVLDKRLVLWWCGDLWFYIGFDVEVFDCAISNVTYPQKGCCVHAFVYISIHGRIVPWLRNKPTFRRSTARMSGQFDIRFHEWLDDSTNEGTIRRTIERSNGRFDEPKQSRAKTHSILWRPDWPKTVPRCQMYTKTNGIQWKWHVKK